MSNSGAHAGLLSQTILVVGGGIAGGNFTVTIQTTPRYANANCTACGVGGRGLSAISAS